jgi:hypothetical protein
MTRSSRGLERDVEKLGRRLPVLEAFSDHAKGERLNSGYGLIAVSAVAHDARQIGHLGEPAAVGLRFQLNREGHDGTVPPRPAAQQALAADGGWCDPEPPRLKRVVTCQVSTPFPSSPS